MKITHFLPPFHFPSIHPLVIFLFSLAIPVFSYLGYQQFARLQNQLGQSLARQTDLQKQLEIAQNELQNFKNEDQYLRNQKLQEEINAIQKTYSSGSAVLAANEPPASGYRRQTVNTPDGSFLIDIITADLNNTRVIVDTASEKDCRNDCPVLSLADYVSRNNAFAGINGSYFCPAEYPTCADKKNSFDTLLMNKNKVYFNSDNNVYSTVPAVIFKDNWARFVGQSLEWGRDTSVDSVLANRPLLTSGGQIAFSGEGEPKEGNQGGRSFVGTKDNLVFIGVVRSATVAQAAQVLQTLGIANALNLDDGGSTALWFSGYQVGPGRHLPNALLFVKK